MSVLGAQELLHFPLAKVLCSGTDSMLTPSQCYPILVILSILEDPFLQEY